MERPGVVGSEASNVDDKRFVPLKFRELSESEMVRRAGDFHGEMTLRRSVRHFSDRAVPREILEQAILTASTAPSGAHKQPWHFALIGDAEIKVRIREAAEAEEKESYKRRMPRQWIEDLEPLGTDWHKPFLTTCPWLVVVFAVQYGLNEETGKKRKHYYVQESVGISVGILLTALHLAGLATLTHTPSPMGFLQRIVGRPANERPYMLVAVGLPEEDCRVPDLRRKTKEQVLTVL